MDSSSQVITGIERQIETPDNKRQSAMSGADLITPEQAGSLAGLLRERARRTPNELAYRDFNPDNQTWEEVTWIAAAKLAGRWQAALSREGLSPGDRVAVMSRNCTAWVLYDQAALGLGLVVVPLYTEDRADNGAYILNNSGAQVLLFEGEEQWNRIKTVIGQLGAIKRFVSLRKITDASEPRLAHVAQWLPAHAGDLKVVALEAQSLATIVYTSGTTGRPKGVMLSHHNILSNAWSGLQTFTVSPDDRFLSFLPLSHMLERMAGLYLPAMAGAGVIYARSVAHLAEDMITHQPTVLISVPRIYERVYARVNEQLLAKSSFARQLFHTAVDVGWSRFEHAQGRGPWQPKFLLWPLLQKLVADKILARLGGRVRCAVSGGAALSPEISKVFLGLGLPVLQGYGLTETSPLLCVNRLDDNDPASVGKAVVGTELKIGENDALMARGAQVMLGYWHNPEATKAVLSGDGWLNTGDQARIDDRGHVYITGRLKEIIVLANGEKVPPVDMELAIATDPLFEQVMVLGEGKPYLTAMVSLNAGQWNQAAQEAGLSAAGPTLETEAGQKLLLDRITQRIGQFPGYAQIRRVAATLQPWTVDNGFLTPTMKMKRAKVLEHFSQQIAQLYEGH
jgi:long-chain acyl-CoA synthetase